MPHRNDTAGCPALCPNQNYSPMVEQANGNVPLFAVIPAVIVTGDGYAGKHLSGPREIKTPFP